MGSSRVWHSCNKRLPLKATSANQKPALSLFNELKRRNVLRVAAAYVVASWLIIQVVETIFPAFGFGDAAVRIVTIVVAIGLIPALILAWAFELTPEGLKKESEVDRSQPADHEKGKTFDRAVMVVLALALAFFAADKFILSESRMESARQEGRSKALTESAARERFERSIAVLPFATTGTDAALESYASGLTNELRDRLSGYQELQTIIAASNASPDSVSPNSVTYVVEGGIQRIGDDRRIRVQLIRSADRQVVWSETYDETETDTADPAVLASTMGRFIRLQLVQDQECQAVKRKSQSMEAAELVCAAQAQNYRVNQRGAFDPQLMRANAERAVSLDPNLVEAFQVLPIAYTFLAAYGQLSVEEASRLAHVALERPLAIEPDDAYTLFLLGVVESNLDFDSDSAEATFRKAIANEPLHPNARWFHDQLGKIEIRRGNLAAAFDHYRRAIRIFDSDGRILAEYAQALYFAGEFRDAIETADVARTLSPSAAYTWFLNRTKFYAQRSLGDETQAEATLNEYLSSAEPGWKPFAAGMLATMGKTDEARRSIALIESRSRPSTYPLSLAYVELGEHDQAFEWLRKGIEGSDFILVNWIRVDTAFDALRKDPRWEEVMDQLERQEAKGRARNQKYASQ